MSALSTTNPIIKVSSTLNRDVKNYGKKHLIDGSNETCWNSDNGKDQWISIQMDAQKHLKSFTITFQGGFAASKIEFL